MKSLQPGCDLPVCSRQVLWGQQLVLDLGVQEAPSGSVSEKDRYAAQYRGSWAGELDLLPSVLRKPIVFFEDNSPAAPTLEEAAAKGFLPLIPSAFQAGPSSGHQQHQLALVA